MLWERDIEPFELKFIARLTKSIFCSRNIWYTLCVYGPSFFLVQFTQIAINEYPTKEREKNIVTGLDVIQTFLQRFFFSKIIFLCTFSVIKK